MDLSRRVRHLAPYVSFVLFGLSLWVLHHVLKGYHYRDVAHYLHTLPRGRVLLSVVLTALSYVVLTGYDVLALRFIDHRLPYRRVGFASFIGFSFSNTVGHSLLSGGSIRYRLYSAWGLTAVEVMEVALYCIATFWLGCLFLFGVVYLVAPPVLPAVFPLPAIAMKAAALISLGVVVAYGSIGLIKRNGLVVRGYRVALPTPGMALRQTGVAACDLLLAGGALYALLPDGADISFVQFLGIYLVATVGGLLSLVPGGLGVFDTLIVLLLGSSVAPTALLGSLVAFRGLYYLLPLILACGALGAHELRHSRDDWKLVGAAATAWLPRVVPHLLALGLLVAGAILLVSGSLPTLPGRLQRIAHLLPLGVLETSHFLGSLVGAALLLLARGVQRRLDGAYYLSCGLLGLGVILSLARRLGIEEAAALLAILLALLPCRRHFYRKASLLNQTFTPAWISTVAIILLSAIWLGIFAYQHVAYSADLWWRFSLHANAPRFLRASVGGVALVMIFALARLLRPAPPRPTPATPAELDRARPIIAQSSAPESHLALLGDKTLLFNNADSAFIMYGTEGRSWVSMGDPVGPRPSASALIWRFRELCDLHDDWPVFYEVSEDYLPEYIDLGLTLTKLGEYGRVPLDGFSLQGSARSDLRQAVRKAEKEGCSFELLEPARVRDILPQLRIISDQWLAEKQGSERSFSLGSFREDYIAQFPVGVVRKEGRLVAFANVWSAAPGGELTADIMRYGQGAPRDTMTYLFTMLMLWGAENHYAWFGLGMAPLSGLEEHELAPFWHKLGNFIFSHGEHFYNFQGLRLYKEKFKPEWSPRYLASPGGLALPQVMLNLTSLISGSLRNVV